MTSCSCPQSGLEKKSQIFFDGFSKSRPPSKNKIVHKRGQIATDRVKNDAEKSREDRSSPRYPPEPPGRPEMGRKFTETGPENRSNNTKNHRKSCQIATTLTVIQSLQSYCHYNHSVILRFCLSVVLSSVFCVQASVFCLLCCSVLILL